MKKYSIAIAAFVIIAGCSQNKNNTSPPENTNADTANFFPVTPFLQGQIQLLDSLPVTILQLATFKGKTDSAWLPVNKVKPQLQPFLADTIDKNNLAILFKETKFNDQSTEAITFMYDPKNALPANLGLRRWDVYVDPEKGTVKRIYIVRQVKEGNIKATQQLTWKTGKWAKIVTIKDPNDTMPSEIKWVWDLTEEAAVTTDDKLIQEKK